MTRDPESIDRRYGQPGCHLTRLWVEEHNEERGREAGCMGGLSMALVVGGSCN